MWALSHVNEDFRPAGAEGAWMMWHVCGSWGDAGPPFCKFLRVEDWRPLPLFTSAHLRHEQSFHSARATQTKTQGAGQSNINVKSSGLDADVALGCLILCLEYEHMKSAWIA